MDHEQDWKYCKIVEQNENGEIVLHQNNLQNLIDTWNEIRKEDNSITIVSFIGPQSCGKSFFSNLYVEYVRMQSSLSWTKRIKRDGLKGFSYGVEPNTITTGQLIPDEDIDAIYFYPELIKRNVDQWEEFICILHVHRGIRKNRNKEVDMALDTLLAMMSSILVNIVWNDKNTLNDINELVTDPRYSPIRGHLTGNTINLLRSKGLGENENLIQLAESPSLHDNTGLVKLSYQQYSAVNSLMKEISASQNVKQPQVTLSNILERFKENVKIINVCNGLDTPFPTPVPEHTPETKSPDDAKFPKRQNELEHENVRMPKEMEDKIKAFFSSQFSELVKPEMNQWIQKVTLNQNFVPMHNEFSSFLQYYNEQNITRLFSEARAEFQGNQKLINEEILECIQNFCMIMNTQFEDMPHLPGSALRKALNDTLALVTADLNYPESKEHISKALKNLFKFYYEQVSSNKVRKSISTHSGEVVDEGCKTTLTQQQNSRSSRFPEIRHHNDLSNLRDFRDDNSEEFEKSKFSRTDTVRKSKEQQRKENEAMKEKARKLNESLKTSHETKLEGHVELGEDDLQSYHNNHVKVLLERYEDGTPYPRDSPEFRVYQDILKDELKMIFNVARLRQRKNKQKKEASVTLAIKSALGQYESRLQEFMADNATDNLSVNQLMNKSKETREEILDELKTKVGIKPFSEIAEKTEQKIEEIFDKYRSKASQSQNTAADKSLHMISKYQTEYTKIMINFAKSAKDEKSFQREHVKVADNLIERFEAVSPSKTTPRIFRQHVSELKRNLQDAYSDVQEIFENSQKNEETSSKLAIGEARQFYCLEMDKHKIKNEYTFKKDLEKFHAKTCIATMKKFPGLKAVELKESVKLSFQKYQDEMPMSKSATSRDEENPEGTIFGRKVIHGRRFGGKKLLEDKKSLIGDNGNFGGKSEEMIWEPFPSCNRLSNKSKLTSIPTPSTKAIINRRELPPLLYQIALRKIGIATLSQNSLDSNSSSISIQSHSGEVGILINGNWVCDEDVKTFYKRGEVYKAWSFEVIFNTYEFNDVLLINKDYFQITLPFLLSVFFGIMKQRAEYQHNGKISAAMISVPFWFSSYKRTQIVEAVTLAGFDTVQIINENTASAYFPYTSALIPPNEMMVVISENSTKVDISIYSFDQQSKIISLQGHSGVFEIAEFSKSKGFSQKIKTIKRIENLWDMAQSRVRTYKYPEHLNVLISCESNFWREILWEFASKITSLDKILVRNGSPLLGLASFFDIFLKAKNIPLESLFKDAIPFDITRFQGSQQCSAVYRNDTFFSTLSQHFRFEIPKSV